MIAPLIIYPIAKYGFGMESPMTLYPTIFGTTVVWLIVTYMTRPVTESHLLEFYKRAHPGGKGWQAVAEKLPEIKGDTGFLWLFMDWVLGVILVYSVLFGFGQILFGEYWWGFLMLLIGILCGYGIYKDQQKRGFESITN
jgi:hypothetical protein